MDPPLAICISEKDFSLVFLEANCSESNFDSQQQVFLLGYRRYPKWTHRESNAGILGASEVFYH